MKAGVDEKSLCDAAGAFLGRKLAPVEWLEGGDEALVLRAASDNEEFVLHVSPRRLSRDELVWSHAVARHVARKVPEAVAPIERGGKTLIELHGNHLAVFPFVEGSLAGRDNPVHQTAAAIMLARIHRALLDWPDGPRPGASNPVTDLPLDRALVDDELDQWWATEQLDTPRCVIHGDFYQRNLICRGTKIVGVIDWHDAFVAPLALELAGSAFEFSRDANHSLELGKAANFIEAYRVAGGPAVVPDMKLLLRYMRLWLRRDVALNLECGTAVGDPYIKRQIGAFRQLADSAS